MKLLHLVLFVFSSTILKTAVSLPVDPSVDVKVSDLDPVFNAEGNVANDGIIADDPLNRPNDLQLIPDNLGMDESFLLNAEPDASFNAGSNQGSGLTGDIGQSLPGSTGTIDTNSGSVSGGVKNVIEVNPVIKVDGNANGVNSDSLNNEKLDLNLGSNGGIGGNGVNSISDSLKDGTVGGNIGTTVGIGGNNVNPESDSYKTGRLDLGTDVGIGGNTGIGVNPESGTLNDGSFGLNTGVNGEIGSNEGIVSKGVNSESNLLKGGRLNLDNTLLSGSKQQSFFSDVVDTLGKTIKTAGKVMDTTDNGVAEAIIKGANAYDEGAKTGELTGIIKGVTAVGEGLINTAQEAAKVALNNLLPGGKPTDVPPSGGIFGTIFNGIGSLFD